MEEAEVSVPVSVKAALRCGDRWVLLRNDRNEWELPGGRIDPDDATLQDTVRRECREELGVEVQVGPLIDAYLFQVIPDRRVTIICFQAMVAEETDLVLSDEHDAVGLFTDAELSALNLPACYRQSLHHATAS